ncbi:MAG: ATP-binding cassette domain-containing protein [Treponema sp.]|nr:ATP-binding cassette domain-containing protein [Treponema sp.]MCL2126649.1 ATP-binding cassette domain-containing protein [Treponema sp.]
MSSDRAVEFRGISKIYPGSVKKANNSVSLYLRKGEILCIAGENGAGKTTLMKILGGLETPSEGEILINGNPAAIDSPLAARRLGIGMVHQHFMLFPDYTVAENIVMGTEPRKFGLFFDRKKAAAEAAKVISAHQFTVEPGRPVGSLSVGEMQQVEICRLLYRNAQIIILDEPTSVLTEHEAAALFSTLRVLASRGKSLFLITHRLREIKTVSDRVAVLRHGGIAGIRDTKETDEYEIAKLMTGSGLAGNEFSRKPGPENSGPGKTGEPVIAFDGVTVLRRRQERPLLNRLSFSVRPGEIVGFAGVGGNGLGVLEAVLGGFIHPAGGKITHNGKDISRLNIRRLRNQGLAYVPADRLRVGSAPQASISENIIIDRRGEFSRMGVLDRGKIRNFSGGLIRRYNITEAGGESPAAVLSGGNLQKLILAREIDRFRDYFVFSEPTWGLDIAAGGFVRSEIMKLREKGAAIILISTNLDEILALALRIIVMYRGRAAAEFSNAAPGADAVSLRENIGSCMQGLLPEGAAL